VMTLDDWVLTVLVLLLAVGLMASTIALTAQRSVFG